MKVTFWLIPSEADRIVFQTIINELAHTYNAPTFTPHVTIYAGDYTPGESPAELIEKATDGIQPFSLKSDRLLYTDQFTKTVFVQFHPNSTLSTLCETLRHNSRQPSNYTLNPHLSLIYQFLNESHKQALIKTLSPPKSEVWFDEVQAVSTPDKVNSPEDVERWTTLNRKKLQ